MCSAADADGSCPANLLVTGRISSRFHIVTLEKSFQPLSKTPEGLRGLLGAAKSFELLRRPERGYGALKRWGWTVTSGSQNLSGLPIAGVFKKRAAGGEGGRSRGTEGMESLAEVQARCPARGVLPPSGPSEVGAGPGLDGSCSRGPQGCLPGRKAPRGGPRPSRERQPEGGTAKRNF